MAYILSREMLLTTFCETHDKFEEKIPIEGKLVVDVCFNSNNPLPNRFFPHKNITSLSFLFYVFSFFTVQVLKFRLTNTRASLLSFLLRKSAPAEQEGERAIE